MTNLVPLHFGWQITSTPWVLTADLTSTHFAYLYVKPEKWSKPVFAVIPKTEVSTRAPWHQHFAASLTLTLSSTSENLVAEIALILQRIAKVNALEAIFYATIVDEATAPFLPLLYELPAHLASYETATARAYQRHRKMHQRHRQAIEAETRRLWRVFKLQHNF